MSTRLLSERPQRLSSSEGVGYLVFLMQMVQLQLIKLIHNYLFLLLRKHLNYYNH